MAAAFSSTGTVNTKEEMNIEVWKAALDNFLRQKLIRGQLEDTPNTLVLKQSYSNGHVESCHEVDGLPIAAKVPLQPSTIQHAPKAPVSYLTLQKPSFPVEQLSIQIARNLIRIAGEFEKERAVILAPDGSYSSTTKGLDEEQVLREINSMNGSINIQSLARVLKDSVNLRTLEASLDYINRNADGWPRVALSFDLVAALYATRAAVDNITWVRDVATSYLQRTHSIPGDGDLSSILNYESDSL